jgi:hypothetical protein
MYGWEAEQAGAYSNATDLYSEGARAVQSSDGILDAGTEVMFSAVLSRPARQMPEQYYKSGFGRFLVRPFQFIIHTI